MSHWPFKVVAGPGDKPMIQGERPPAGTCQLAHALRHPFRGAVWPGRPQPPAREAATLQPASTLPAKGGRPVCQLDAGRTPPLWECAPGHGGRASALHPPQRVARPLCPAPPPAVDYKGEQKTFSAEEISSMVLSKMKETAETYLGGQASARTHGPAGPCHCSPPARLDERSWSRATS